MYWTDWGLKRVEQADMAGGNRQILLNNKTVQEPTGLALDLQGRKLYWADRQLDLVSCEC